MRECIVGYDLKKPNPKIIEATTLLGEIEKWVGKIGGDEPTFMKCTQCCATVCPNCCSICPLPSCQDRVCKVCLTHMCRACIKGLLYYRNVIHWTNGNAVTTTARTTSHAISQPTNDTAIRSRWCTSSRYDCHCCLWGSLWTGIDVTNN